MSPWGQGVKVLKFISIKIYLLINLDQRIGFLLIEVLAYLNLELKIIPKPAIKLIALTCVYITLKPAFVAFFSIGTSSAYVKKGENHTGISPISMTMTMLILSLFVGVGVFFAGQPGAEFNIILSDRTLKLPIFALTLVLFLYLLYSTVCSYFPSITWDNYEITHSTGWPFYK